MNQTNRLYLVICILAATTLAGGLLAWIEYRESGRLRAEGLRSERERENLEKRLSALEKRKHELDAEIADLRSRRGGAVPPMAGDAGPDDQPAASRGPGRFDRRARMNNLAVLLENPEFSRLWNTEQKAALDSRYSALFKALNLSPADLDKFKSLLVEKQAAMMDVMSAARDQGLDPRNSDDRAQIAALLQNAQAQADAGIQQTLGAAQYAQYQTYEQTLTERNVVNQLAVSLSYSGSPLQDSQAEQLVSILAANTPARDTGAGGLGGVGGGGGPFGNRSSPITDAAIAQAQSILTDTQVTALQQLQAQQQAQRQIGEMMRQTANSTAASSSSGASTAQGGAAAPSTSTAAPVPPTD